MNVLVEVYVIITCLFLYVITIIVNRKVGESEEKEK